MSRVVLHIGTHKTATTTVQQSFWAYAPVLAEHGVVYPRLNDIHGHHGLTALWSPVDQVDPAFLLPQGARAGFAEIVRAYADSDMTVVLSSEEFSRSGPNDGVNYQELRSLLDGFDQVQVICVLRPQWQFMQSVFVELCRGMVPPEPKRFVKTGLEKGVFAGLWADYNLLLDRLEDAFGAENVTFLDYNTCRCGPGGVVGGILSVLGLDPLDPSFAGILAGAANVSPPALACWIAAQVAVPGGLPHQIVPQVAEVLVREYGGRVQSCLFSRKEFHQLQKHFTPLNADLIERRQPWQPGFDLEPFAADAITLFREDLGIAFWVQLARLGFLDQLADLCAGGGSFGADVEHELLQRKATECQFI